MRSRISYAIMFAAVFAAVSWMAPAAYYSLAPAESIVEIESTEVTTVDNSTHNLSVTYESQGRYPAEAKVTLYRSEESGDAAVQTWRLDGFLEEGSGSVDLTLTLDEPPPPGGYYYEIEATFHVGYNVERQITATTSTFSLPPESNATAENSTDVDDAATSSATTQHHAYTESDRGRHGENRRRLDSQREPVRAGLVRSIASARR